MAVETSLPALLTTLTQSLNSAIESAPESSLIKPPTDGISLLDVKNELLLSYLEKGVRPLEGRLKYQIDKVLRASDDAIRALAPTPKPIGTKGDAPSDEDDSESEDDSDADGDGAPLENSQIDDLQYRPNPSSLLRPAAATEDDSKHSSDGIYKPPRITATAMPTTERREKKDKKANKSATLDEFINTELSAAPIAEASIGSNIIAGGRRSKSDKEKKEDDERREYEERNYTRLPKENKKDRAKKNKAGGRQDAGYGGEEWRGLGEGIDRIERLTKRKSGSGGGMKDVLEKSRKRSVEDGPRGSGMQTGEGFQKRFKMLDGRGKDRGTSRK